MTIGEILRGAAAEVRRGWMQGDLSDDAGNVCAVGAICRVLKTLDEDLVRTPEEWNARQFVSRALGLKRSAKKPWGDPLPDWNDAEGQTAENVAAGLEYAALVWEQEQAATQPAEAVCETTCATK